MSSFIINIKIVTFLSQILLTGSKLGVSLVLETATKHGAVKMKSLKIYFLVLKIEILIKNVFSIDVLLIPDFIVDKMEKLNQQIHKEA